MYAKVAGKNVRAASRVMATVAAALLLSYMVELVWQTLPITAFLAIDAESKGMIYGVLSAVLFVAAFLLELREKSMITSGLIISGGATMGTLAIARNTLSELGVANISASFAGVSSLGYVIMGLGILHLVKLRENRG
ncbi:hypothetical protein [Nitrososphaera sp.]|uniref:hypothetical protein n=1 Tax=Nitrososphaera sp. TaxID=1971748 RepID=UPI003177DA47